MTRRWMLLSAAAFVVGATANVAALGADNTKKRVTVGVFERTSEAKYTPDRSAYDNAVQESRKRQQSIETDARKTHRVTQRVDLGAYERTDTRERVIHPSDEAVGNLLERFVGWLFN